MKNLKKFWNTFGCFIVPIVAALLLTRTVFGLYNVPTASMEPSVHAGSVIVAWKLPFTFKSPTPEYGDVVAFDSSELGYVLLKRVIGLPGDTISFADGYTYRNGEKLDEPYLPEQGITESDKTFTVPEGCFFAMGDNRTNSVDCRRFNNPYIPIDSILGRELFAIAF